MFRGGPSSRPGRAGPRNRPRSSSASSSTRSTGRPTASTRSSRLGKGTQFLDVSEGLVGEAGRGGDRARHRQRRAYAMTWQGRGGAQQDGGGEVHGPTVEAALVVGLADVQGPASRGDATRGRRPTAEAQEGMERASKQEHDLPQADEARQSAPATTPAGTRRSERQGEPRRRPESTSSEGQLAHRREEDGTAYEGSLGPRDQERVGDKDRWEPGVAAPTNQNHRRLLHVDWTRERARRRLRPGRRRRGCRRRAGRPRGRRG